jgi:recombination protein RecA
MDTASFETVSTFVPERGDLAGRCSDQLNRNAAQTQGYVTIERRLGVVYGNPETTTGGNALKFYASVRLDIRKIGTVKNGEQIVGNHARVKVVKNKVAPPFREAEFDILYGVGVNAPGEIVDLASAANLFEKSGAFYSFRGERIGQGRDKASAYVAEHPEIAVEVRRLLLEARKAENAALGVPVAPAAVQAA